MRPLPVQTGGGWELKDVRTGQLANPEADGAGVDSQRRGPPGPKGEGADDVDRLQLQPPPLAAALLQALHQRHPSRRAAVEDVSNERLHPERLQVSLARAWIFHGGEVQEQGPGDLQSLVVVEGRAGETEARGLPRSLELLAPGADGLGEGEVPAGHAVFWL